MGAKIKIIWQLRIKNLECDGGKSVEIGMHEFLLFHLLLISPATPEKPLMGKWQGVLCAVIPTATPFFHITPVIGKVNTRYTDKGEYQKSPLHHLHKNRVGYGLY